MTYYKYQERSADSQINWAEIGKSMSDMLKNEAETRIAKKDAIDQASREFGEVLSNAPTGDYDAGNTFALTYANDAQQFRLMQDTLLKSGQLSLKDYTIGRQNINDNTNGMFSLAKEYQDEYRIKMDRWEGDESAFLEVFEMEQAEGLANLKNARGYINPTNGVVSVGKMVKNSKTGVMEMSKNPNDFVQINQLRARMKQQYNKYKLNEQAAERVKVLGEVENAVIKYAGQGSLNTVLTEIDAKGGKYAIDGEAKKFASEYKDWENMQIQSMLAVPNNIGSILTDTKVTAPNGEKYTYTYDKAEFDAQGKGGNLIYRDTSKDANGSSVFTDEQKEIAEAQARVAIRAQIDVKKQAKAAGITPYEPTSITEGKDAYKNKVDLMNNLGELYYGTAGQIDSASNFLLGLVNKGIPSDGNKAVEVDRSTTGVTIKYRNGDFRTFKFKDSKNNTIPQDDWIIGAVTEFTDIKDVSKVLEDSAYIKGKTLSAEIGSAKFNIKQKPSASDSYDSYIQSLNIKTKNLSEDDWVKQYGQVLKDLGYTLDFGADGKDVVTISKGKDDNYSEHVITTDTKGAEAQTEANDLIKYLKRSMSKAEIVQLIDAGIFQAKESTSGSGIECKNGRKIDEATGADLGAC